MTLQTSEAQRLLPYLYSLDARAAGNRLVQLGAASVDGLIGVLNGQYHVPDLKQLPAAEVDGTLLVCVGIDAPPNHAAARERAAYLLGDIGDTRAVEPLIAAFNAETERHARLAMVRALGKIGDPRAVDTLIAALETPAWTPDYRKLVDDLARLGGERSIAPLIRLMQSKTYTYGSAAQAARALRAHRADPRVLDGLIGALRLDAEFSTLEAVIAGLAEVGDPRGARGILKLLNQMVALPAERWDERDDNLSETEQGVIYHILKSEFRDAVSAIRKIGDADTLAALDQIMAQMNIYIPRT